MKRVPILWVFFSNAKNYIKRVACLRYFIFDAVSAYRCMHWSAARTDRCSFGAELLFQYHKLEKGLVMPGERRLFGLEPARAVVSLLERWRQAGWTQDDPVFVGAVETLRAYRHRLENEGLDRDEAILPLLRRVLLEHASVSSQGKLSTPQLLEERSETASINFSEGMRTLAELRRSVRDFLPDVVPLEIIENSVRVAQLSPSACNRQPCSLLLVERSDLKSELLGLQNGNRGFGHLAPHIGVILADESCFFDASERHEPYVDGGMFAMSLILALSANGVGSCCLNWCVSPSVDKAAHVLLGLAPNQRILMLVVFGFAPLNCVVPRSSRRSLSEVLKFA